MEAEAVLNLFDSFWFCSLTFENQSKPSISSTPEQKSDHKPQQKSSKLIVSIPTRSKSEQLIISPSYYTINSMTSDISSADSVLHLKPHLETILSEKEISIEIPKKSLVGNNLKISKQKNKKRLSKSLSELEFEEVKGFMDLGFEFSEEDNDSSLAQIIPGLQKLGRAHQELCGPRARPYLSEAWEVWDKQKEEGLLLKWKIPALTNEIVMKDSLKWWAHTVASAVR